MSGHERVNERQRRLHSGTLDPLVAADLRDRCKRLVKGPAEAGPFVR
jgi:hypothetical protein